MRVINNQKVYDSFEEICHVYPIGSQESHIKTMKNWTWDDDDDNDEITYTDYNQVKTCEAYIYNGDYWVPSFSTRNIKLRTYKRK